MAARTPYHLRRVAGYVAGEVVARASYGTVLDAHVIDIPDMYLYLAPHGQPHVSETAHDLSPAAARSA